jgi:hypothetical protein
MSIASPQQPRTIADMLVALGDIPPERVLMSPPPGTATEQDAIECETRQNRLCDLEMRLVGAQQGLSKFTRTAGYRLAADE